jgi:uncharacterized MnhB-related membrane protein
VIVPLVTLFLVLMLLCAVLALQVKDLLSAVAIFGGFSFFSAIFFTLLGALDVAFTEAAVGAAITTIFFVSAIYRTDREVD